MNKQFVLIASFLLILLSIPALAAPVRVFVADMNAVGVQNKDELRLTLQTLLASRLNSDKITAVGSATEADAIVSGTYVTIGKIFSVDAIAKTSAGRTLTRAFVQGEGQDELIPAVGKLADKLSAELTKIYFTDHTATLTAPPAIFPAPTGTSSAISAPKSDIIKREQVRPAPATEFIKPEEYEHGSASGWVSKRLNGAANLLAIGRSLPDGDREVFLAEDHRLTFFRQGKVMKLVTEIEFAPSEKIVSLDTIDNGNNSGDVYITIIRSDELASQVWQVKDNKLVKVAENLPYYFRSFSLAGGPRKLYAQSMGRNADFYDDLAEAVRNGVKITLGNRIKVPSFGNIYSFNQFTDSDGKTFSVVINLDGYLAVYDQDLKELWRSNDKFGGSELYFQVDDSANARVTGQNFRWIFMNQRIQVTSKGDVLVGKNEGFMVLGNARKYKKGSVYCFSWNGSSLEEKWRTRDTQNYMPDYFYDEARNELLILQTVQRSGITTRGAASLAIKKVE
jgi:hypothetical protein